MSSLASEELLSPACSLLRYPLRSFLLPTPSSEASSFDNSMHDDRMASNSLTSFCVRVNGHGSSSFSLCRLTRLQWSWWSPYLCLTTSGDLMFTQVLEPVWFVSDRYQHISGLKQEPATDKARYCTLQSRSPRQKLIASWREKFFGQLKGSASKNTRGWASRRSALFAGL